MSTEIISEFVKLCHFYGDLNELVQAGGGNISIKDGDNIIIKASGYCLSDVTETTGYSVLTLKSTESQIDDLSKFIIAGEQPSIETYFHLFTHKFTVHLHPTLINIWMCSNRELGAVGVPYVDVGYFKPGIELATEIAKVWTGQKIIFLRSHGVIFTSDSLSDLKDTIASVYNFFTRHMIFFGNGENYNKYSDLSAYGELRESVGRIFRVPKEYNKVTKKINTDKVHYTPDTAVYLTSVCVCAKDGSWYIKAKNKYKYFQILEVLNTYKELSDAWCNTVLTDLQIDELINWDKEKLRKQK
jgi:rhamnose utilization protein RhaD (predicted bifunctional aldolase and dehydrogenase)